MNTVYTIYLLIPPLACGYGKVDPQKAAQEMMQAIQDHASSDGFNGSYDNCHYIVINKKIMNQQPNFYENTEFINIDPKDIVKS